MSAVICPHCQAQIPFIVDLAGSDITCGNCKGVFRMPVASPSTSQLAAPASLPHVATPVQSQKSAFKRATKRRFKTSTSILDIFDLRFNKYVSPLIVRITWMATLVFAVLYLVVTVIGWENFVASGPRSWQQPAWFFKMMLKIIEIGFIGMIVLWIRLSLESVILAFDVARGITNIDKNTGGKD